jgi:F-type H+-transporting ATPase subunit epsilon
MAAPNAPAAVAFDLVTPERLVASRPVEMVVVPGTEGDMGILPGHSLLVGTVRPGVAVVYEGGKPVERLFVAGGFVDVTPERCTVLAEEAMPVAEIDREDVGKRARELRDQIDENDKDPDLDRRQATANKIWKRIRIEEAKLAALNETSATQ